MNDKERILELTDAFNKVCAENADFVVQSNKDEARIAELERLVAVLVKLLGVTCG